MMGTRKMALHTHTYFPWHMATSAAFLFMDSP